MRCGCGELLAYHTVQYGRLLLMLVRRIIRYCGRASARRVTDGVKILLIYPVTWLVLLPGSTVEPAASSLVEAGVGLGCSLFAKQACACEHAHCACK